MPCAAPGQGFHDGNSKILYIIFENMSIATDGFPQSSDGSGTDVANGGSTGAATAAAAATHCRAPAVSGKSANSAARASNFDGIAVSAGPRPSTSRLIADALRAGIIDGTLAPGARLRQDAIARHFSVSAIPVREALRQLESEGWIVVELNKGATVSALSAGEAREIYEIRAALESLAIELAIPLHTSDTLARSAELHRAATLEPDESRHVAQNEAFHLSLCLPCGRPKLCEMIDGLHRRGERYLRLKFGLPSFKGESDQEHLAILDAVRDRDIPSAQALLARHLLATGELVYRFLSARNADADAGVGADAAAQPAPPPARRGRPRKQPVARSHDL
jgi:DNA-binding GntR family transcriptional regulator